MQRRSIAALFLFACVFVGVFVWVHGRTHPLVTKSDGMNASTTVVSIGDTNVRAEVVRTPEEQERGLSGREGLAEGAGMLFVFSYPDTYGFWMPDMRFPIDIIWIDESLRVAHIQENATPASYPEVFRPTTPALYVLEVPAGFVTLHHVVQGSEVAFSRGVR